MILEMTTKLPNSLVITSVEAISTSFIKLLSMAHWMETLRSTHNYPLTLEAARKCCKIANKWALSWIVSSDNGKNVTGAIKQVTTYGFSDSS
jgi:hypothetical protein